MEAASRAARDGDDVAGGDVEVLEPLDDEELAADVADEMDGGAVAIFLGDYVGGATEHFGAVGRRSGRVVW